MRDRQIAMPYIEVRGYLSRAGSLLIPYEFYRLKMWLFWLCCKCLYTLSHFTVPYFNGFLLEYNLDIT